MRGRRSRRSITWSKMPHSPHCGGWPIGPKGTDRGPCVPPLPRRQARPQEHYQVYSQVSTSITRPARPPQEVTRMGLRGTATPHRKDNGIEDRPLDPRKLARICLAQPEAERHYFLNSLQPDI